MDDLALDGFVVPVPARPRPQPRLHRLIRRLADLRPNIAIRVDVENGNFALEIFEYDRPTGLLTNPALELMDIRRIEFPCYEDGFVLLDPEQLIEHWIRRAQAPETASGGPRPRRHGG